MKTIYYIITKMLIFKKNFFFVFNLLFYILYELPNINFLRLFFLFLVHFLRKRKKVSSFPLKLKFQTCKTVCFYSPHLTILVRAHMPGIGATLPYE